MIALGTEMKFDVHIEPIGELSMSDYDFECAFFVYANKKSGYQEIGHDSD